MACLSNLTSTICPLPNFPPFAREWISVSSRSNTNVFCDGFAGINGRGINCTAVLGVVTANEVCVFDVMEGVRGEVGDFSESAVRRRLSAINSSFSEELWRRGERRREGIDEALDASLMSEGASVEMSVSASESVPEEDASLTDEEEDNGRRGKLSEDVTSGNV